MTIFELSVYEIILHPYAIMFYCFGIGMLCGTMFQKFIMESVRSGE